MTTTANEDGRTVVRPGVLVADDNMPPLDRLEAQAGNGSPYPSAWNKSPLDGSGR